MDGDYMAVLSPTWLLLMDLFVANLWHNLFAAVWHLRGAHCTDGCSADDNGTPERHRAPDGILSTRPGAILEVATTTATPGEVKLTRE